jgi:ABC-type multidrug transport system fused ATPase/permease subunit
MLNIGGTAWLAFSAIALMTRIIYIGTVLTLGLYLISLIQQGLITSIMGASLIITYINGTREVLKVGRKIRKFLKSVTRVKDLFSFICSFGNQTFPVLEETPTSEDITVKPACSQDREYISLDATRIHFNYEHEEPLFKGHSLHLDVSCSTIYKLYGIIGPSGVGKTTFLSILGGQIKPIKGSVLLQGIDIYNITDVQRRQLIAMQGQVASSMRGSLKDNLLFGLPFQKDIYDDETLIQTLQDVGLWHIFKDKGGLKTYVGESGLTMSGGQRQRLNFANLYLRSRYFKPYLILIDEPTSSLDQISEQAITRMIKELSKTSLTLVIAHRLKTVEDAQGIIDFSLIDGHQKIMVYSKEELAQHSPYYTKLIKGEATFD